MKAEDRAYLAGLFEGEGSISYYIQNTKARKNKKVYEYKSRAISLRIRMTDLHPLELFQDLTGCGRLYTNRDGGVTPNGVWRKKYHDLQITNFEEIQYVICHMWFWLSPRRKEQISKALTGYTSKAGLDG